MNKPILVLLLLIASLALNAQEEKFKALFLYNFSKNIEWPADNRESFNVAVVGNSPVYGELLVIAKKGKVGDLPISVKKVNSIAEVTGCNMVFVSNNKSSLIPEAAAKLSSLPVLLITENSTANQEGVGIRFIMVGGKLKFEISRKYTQKNGIKVSPSLFALGSEI
ncbi:MAG: YfiR family protein [Salinivirgaceae bacterium]|jgi:hypothetical protein